MKQCKIIVKDEVNCKIEGLELTERKALVKMFEYDVPGARYLPAVRLGRWNGKVSFFSLGGSSYVNLLPEILPFIDSRDYDIELEDLRTYSTTFKFAEVSEETFKHKNWPEGHLLAGTPIMLRNHQVVVCNNFLSNPQSLVVAATGSGKTMVTAALSYRVEKYGRSIVVVPNTDLVKQTSEDYENVGLDVGVFYGGKKDLGKTHTICTWQSLHALVKNSAKEDAEVTIQEFLEGVVCVIVDECHGIKADALKTMLTTVMATIPIRWGLTGTLPKSDMDGISLKVSIGEVVHKLAATELQEMGLLAKCHVNIIQLADTSDYKTYQDELKFLLGDPKRIGKLAHLIHSANNSGNTLVLVDRIAAGTALCDALNDISPDSTVFVSGGTKTKARAVEYQEVATSTNKIIIATYQIAAVGINIPRLFNVVLIEPGKSFIRTIQSIGRGLRMAPDKSFVQITDITSSCKFSKRHLTARKAFYKEAGYEFDVRKEKYD
jgi:superfamily II DNA or RNA helicase